MLDDNSCSPNCNKDDASDDSDEYEDGFPIVGTSAWRQAGAETKLCH